MVPVLMSHITSDVETRLRVMDVVGTLLSLRESHALSSLPGEGGTCTYLHLGL